MCIENAYLLINRMKIRYQIANLPNFTKMITWLKQYVKAKQDVEFYNQGEIQLGKTNKTGDIAIRP